MQWMMEAVKETLRKLSGKKSRGKKGSEMALPWTLKYMHSCMMYIIVYIDILYMHMTLHSIRTVGTVFQGAPDANTMPVIFDSYFVSCSFFTYNL